MNFQNFVITFWIKSWSEFVELSERQFSEKNFIGILISDREMIERHGVSFRVLGNWSLLPLDIQQMIAEGVAMTRHNNRSELLQ